MPRAYVRIWVEAAREAAVRESLRADGAVRAADLTAGDQDLVAIVEALSYQDLLEVVCARIRQIRGVIRTSMSIVSEASASAQLIGVARPPPEIRSAPARPEPPDPPAADPAPTLSADRAIAAANKLRSFRGPPRRDAA